MCYQIPALAKPGIVLVVSPLIGFFFLGLSLFSFLFFPLFHLALTFISVASPFLFCSLDG